MSRHRVFDRVVDVGYDGPSGWGEEARFALDGWVEGFDGCGFDDGVVLDMFSFGYYHSLGADSLRVGWSQGADYWRTDWIGNLDADGPCRSNCIDKWFNPFCDPRYDNLIVFRLAVDTKKISDGCDLLAEVFMGLAEIARDEFRLP